MIAVGRAPRVDTLVQAGIEFNRQRASRLTRACARPTAVSTRLVTRSRGRDFTACREFHAGLVIRSALFRLPARVDYRALPAVTYTDPELAQVGLTEAAARKQHGDDVEVLHAPFMHNDRAETELETGGMVYKVMTGTILGASILGPHAGELIYPSICCSARKQSCVR